MTLQVRLFQDIDLKNASYEYYDGWKHLGPDYDSGIARRAGD